MISYRKPEDSDIRTTRYRFGRVQTSVPYISSTDRAPTLSEVESFRRDTESIYKLCLIHCASADRLGNKDRKKLPVSRPEPFSCACEARKAGTFARYRFEQNLNIYTKLSCLWLTHRVTTGLPREVRDVIYASLLDQHIHCGELMGRIPVPVRRPEIILFSHTTTNSTRTSIILQLGMPRLAYKHCWDQSFCGEPFIQELAEVYYGRFTFVFRGTQHLPAFLGFEISGDKVSPLPGRYLSLEHVDKLVINLWRGSYLTISGAANVQALLKLERKANIEIILQGSSGLWWNVEGDLEDSIWINRHVFPVLAALREKGHALSVRFEPPDKAVPNMEEVEIISNARLEECIASAEPGVPLPFA